MKCVVKFAVVGVLALMVATGCAEYDAAKESRDESRKEARNRGYIDLSEPVGAPEKKADDKADAKDASQSEAKQ